jgi:hypothetical protein
MQKSFRLILVASLIGLGIWGWRVLFPGPEQVIRSRLRSLASTACFNSSNGIVARGYKIQALPDYFTPDAVVNLEIRGYPAETLHGRPDLQTAASAAMQQLSGLRVEFLDINVTVAPDGQSAVANLTCRASRAGDRDFVVQEFDFHLKRVGRDWLIERVDTVKTLSRTPPRRVPVA